MIPEGRIAKLFCKVGGDEKLFSLAKDNLVSHLQSQSQAQTATYLACNGVSHAISKEDSVGRLYTFRDTEIDGAYLSSESDVASIADAIQEENGFKDFQKLVEENSCLKVQPYVSELRVSHVPGAKEGDADIEIIAPVTVGIRVTAESSDDFKQGLQQLEDWTLKNHKADYSKIKIDEKSGIKFSFLDHKSTDTLEL